MALVCKWAKPLCLKTFPTAEELFNHLCDRHVGRKRHGNLSLNCSWEACDHKAAKRDHMTSHMMVHCPLQTNVCGICSKTFKRSYDLRKHEITHTAAHHQAHGRSRAMIYKDVDISFSSGTGCSTPVNHSRVYSCPREQTGESLALSSSSKSLVAPSAARRGSSVPGSRKKPYLRPHSATPTPTPVDDLQFLSPNYYGYDHSEGFSGTLARTLSDSLLPTSHHHPAQLLDSLSLSSSSSTSRHELSKIDWTGGKQTSTANSLQPNFAIAADYSGFYVPGQQPSSTLLRTSSLQCQSSYSTHNHSSFNPYQSFDSLTPAPYPLVDEPARPEMFTSFSTSEPHPHHFQHATNFAAPNRTPTSRHYTETDGNGLPAWQSLPPASEPIVFHNDPASFSVHSAWTEPADQLSLLQSSLILPPPPPPSLPPQSSVDYDLILEEFNQLVDHHLVPPFTNFFDPPPTDQNPDHLQLITPTNLLLAASSSSSSSFDQSYMPQYIP
ncbi:hypothetical protein PGTUg99_034873 [Puccinia graminis f. sp. tritici]|uniref:C2H2-type domain-containing protein n=1 Tax=Puccinia graminis f. sp. tritici TaxID=56615 RepID=A0A5B0SL78_PUCGR|nr:hypothetical protein PGTUg99_034873 [Puccinia graminis f. sp. tritici]